MSIKRVLTDSSKLSKRIKGSLGKRPQEVSEARKAQLREWGALGAFYRWHLYRAVEEHEK